MLDEIVIKLIEQSSNILIISSVPYDADCIASGILIKKYLESLNKRVLLVCPIQPERINKSYFNFLSGLPYSDEMLLKDTRSIDFSQFDTAFLVDGRSYDQFYDIQSASERPFNINIIPTRIHIDHHAPATDPIGTYIIHNQKVSSCTELILETVVPTTFLNKDLAYIAYNALVGDTGNFRWNTYSSTLKLAGDLLEHEFDIQPIVNNMFNEKSNKYFKLLQWCLNTVQYDDKSSTLFLEISKENCRQEQFSQEDILEIREVFTNEIARRVNHYPRGIILIEQESVIEIRAIGNNLENKINLSLLLKKVGGSGAGHPQYANAIIQGTISDIKISLIKSIIQDI